MKGLLLSTMLISSSAFAGMTSTMPSTYFDTRIPNSHQLSENVIRGMAPRNSKDMQRLLDLGVEKFLMFKIDTNGDVAKEISSLESMGVPAKNMLQLNFPWKDVTDFVPVCEMTVDALNFIKVSEDKNQKIYFHCTVGEDRTGYLAGLYRIYRGDNEMTHEVFEHELCDHGYEAGNPNKGFNVVKAVRASLTPAFLGMVDLIEKNNGKKLTKALCKSFTVPKVNFKEYSCKKSNLL
ncbi:MAG: dual specificity protein phosphatase family protein [Rhizobacter sp.]|nr:dual specificity protein phosphatase family protein [Bacteriovorax sp.]